MANTIRIKATIIAICTWIFYYWIRRLFSIFHINLPKWTIVLIAACIAIFIAIFIAVISISSFTYKWSNNKILDIFGTISTRLLTLWVILFTLLLVENVISIRYKPNPRITTWIIIVILCLWIFFSLKTKVTTYEINTDKINKDTRILLVSDIHVDHIYKDFHVKKIQKIIESEKPDFVLIAWDMMNKANYDYSKYFWILKNKDIPIFAVMWNHDMMWNKESIDDIQKNSSIKLLKNESIEYEWIQIIWIIDKSIWWDNTLQENLEKSKIDKNSNNFWILITHQPISLEKLKDYPIDLEVAGHTHRWQVFWLRKVVEMVNDYWYWRYDENWKTAIVTQWIWTWGLPFRLWTQSEMVIINLKKN